MEDSNKSEVIPSMTSLFGSDSEEDEEVLQRDDTDQKDESKISEDEDVEFQEDDITGISAPRARARTQSKPAPRYSSVPDYDDSNSADGAHPKDDDHLAGSMESLPPRQIILPEAPALMANDSDIMSSYALSSKEQFSFHLVHLPKLVTINTQEYDAASFDAKAESEEFQRQIHNMIRWRYFSKDNDMDDSMADAEQYRESNANIIQWSDGTLGLAVGDEVFELDEFPFSSSTTEVKSNVIPGSIESKDFLYLSTKGEVNIFDESKEGGELSEDNLVDTVTTTILQCIVPLKSKLIPRPASIQSAAHKAFMLAEKSRNMKRANIGEYVPVKDPELEKAERIRNNEDLSKQKKRNSTGEGRSSYGRYSGRRSTGRALDPDDDDDDGLYDSVNIRDLKRKSHDMDVDEDYGDDDDDEEEDEWSKRKKKLFVNARNGGSNTKRPSTFSSESEDEDGDAHVSEDDDEDDDVAEKIATRRKITKSSLFAEDDDDD